jgi:hypothetical protein
LVVHAFDGMLLASVSPLHRALSLLRSRLPCLVMAALMAFCVMSLTLNPHHRCVIGIKWFERHGPEILGGGVCVLVLTMRRALSAVAISLLLLGGFNAIVPPYLKWVHDPKSRFFDAQRQAREEQMRKIDAAIDAYVAARDAAASLPSVPPPIKTQTTKAP